MARIRSIKPEFWTSEQVVECSPIARLLFLGLLNFCDDGGVHPFSLRRIKMEIFPSDDFSSTDILRMLDELSSNELIAVFEAEGIEYLHVTGWDRHQKVDRPTIKYPRPPKDWRKRQNKSTNVRRALDEPSPPERKGEEGRGEEESPLTPLSERATSAKLSVDHDQIESIARRICEAADKSLDAYLAAGKIGPLRQVRAWLADGWEPERLVERAWEILQGKGVGEPFAYLAKALKDELPKAQEPAFSMAEQREAESRWRRALDDWADAGEPGPRPKLEDFEQGGKFNTSGRWAPHVVAA